MDELNKIVRRYVSDTIRSVQERGDDYDSIDMLIDILAATVISELRDYYEGEYIRVYNDGLDGLIDSEPEDLAVYEAIYAEFDGKTFEDRVREHMNTLLLGVLLSEDSDDLAAAADKLCTALDLLAGTDIHRIRNHATQTAAEDLSSVGYIVTKTWRGVLDRKERDAHVRLEGVTIPYDEVFEIDGFKALAPGLFGVAELDCNCRCRIELNVMEE